MDCWVVSPVIHLSGQGGSYLSYWQFVATADTGDGGVVEISVDGGPFAAIDYFGWYSNKTRGMQLKKMPGAQQAAGMDEPDTPYRRKLRMTWAALIKAVYEVNPLKCPKRCTEPGRSVRGHDEGGQFYRANPANSHRKHPATLRALERGCAKATAAACP